MFASRLLRLTEQILATGLFLLETRAMLAAIAEFPQVRTGSE
jgi:hypothetical protein